MILNIYNKGNSEFSITPLSLSDKYLIAIGQGMLGL